MGIRLHHVSRVVLVCVVMLLRDTTAAQASDPIGFVDLQKLLPQCSLSYGWETLTRRCLHPEKIRFKDNATGPVFSFFTTFSALVDLGPPIKSQPGYGGSAWNALEGFTFALLPHPNASLGGDGGYLGLLNAASNGDDKSQTFAVEFDFVKSPQFSDTDGGFHMGIDINSMNSTSWVPLKGTRYSRSFILNVWIDYNALSQILKVSALDISHYCQFTHEERPELVKESTDFPSTLRHQVELSSVLNEYMYVGFTFSVAAPQLGDPDKRYEPLKIYTSSDVLPCNFSYKPALIYSLSVLLASLIAMAAIYGLLYKCYSRWVERRGWRFKIDLDDLGDAIPHKFTYKELAMATKNFDPKQVLGRGGFGSVYKGFLPGNKQYVAIKRVAPESSQGEREFLAEVMIIGKIRHRNLVHLQGWCHERGELLLVYDYMPQGSLDKHLFGSPFFAKANLSCARDQQKVNKLVVVDEEVVVGFPWERRFKVIVDVATTLVYLHTECEERIIHRDVKAANVMLDAKFNACLGDFGLAHSYNHSLLIPESTNVAGTFGYFAPELFHTGKQTEQTDVYSFGAFMLEVACGKKPIYHEEGKVMLLVDQVWHMWGGSCIIDAADECLRGIFNVHEMTKVLCLGLLCFHPIPAMQPSMHQVLLILNGDEMTFLRPQMPTPCITLHWQLVREEMGDFG